MTPDFYLCDVCGSRVPKEDRLFIATGRSSQGSGSAETVGENIDLCSTHLKHLLQELLRRSPGYELGNLVTNIVSSQMSKQARETRINKT